MLNYKSFRFRKGNKLYLHNTYTGIHLIEHPEYHGMYYISTPDGVSKDFYNLTRAKDNAKKAMLLENNIELRTGARIGDKALEKAADALFSHALSQTPGNT